MFLFPKVNLMTMEGWLLNIDRYRSTFGSIFNFFWFALRTDGSNWIQVHLWRPPQLVVQEPGGEQRGDGGWPLGEDEQGQQLPLPLLPRTQQEPGTVNICSKTALCSVLNLTFQEPGKHQLLCRALTLTGLKSDLSGPGNQTNCCVGLSP